MYKKGKMQRLLVTREECGPSGWERLKTKKKYYLEDEKNGKVWANFAIRNSVMRVRISLQGLHTITNAIKNHFHIYVFFCHNYFSPQPWSLGREREVFQQVMLLRGVWWWIINNFTNNNHNDFDFTLFISLRRNSKHRSWPSIELVLGSQK